MGDGETWLIRFIRARSLAGRRTYNEVGRGDTLSKTRLDELVGKDDLTELDRKVVLVPARASHRRVVSDKRTPTRDRE